MYDAYAVISTKPEIAGKEERMTACDNLDDPLVIS